MPWRTKSVLEQRKLFVIEHLKDEISFASLCRDFGISRKTGYKWVERFETGGFVALEDGEHRPQSFRESVSVEIVCEIIKVRKDHESWGGNKIRNYLVRQKRYALVPCSRTIDRILKRCGLVTRRYTSSRVFLPKITVIKPKECNDVWTSDFKGWWRTLDGKRCEPLTIRDELPRFILRLTALSSTTFEVVKEHYEDCFLKYGLPLYMRFDNGAPFAAIRGFMRLSRFGVWLLKIGVTPNPIAPASPHMNGAHERMHRDIKRELQRCPARNLKEEQKRFDTWRHEFNHIRPHDALGGNTPAEHYKSSSRKYVPNIEFEYPPDFEIRKVSRSGEFSWHSRPVQFSKAFSDEYIGIENNGDGALKVWYCDYLLGYADLSFRHPIQRLDQPLRQTIGRRIV